MGIEDEAHLRPRRWWRNTLDVERLAWEAVVRARDAAQAVANDRGSTVQIGTDTALIAAAFAAIEHLRVDGTGATGWAPLSGFFPAADGWVRTHGNYPHHADAIERALGATTPDGLTEAMSSLTAEEVEQTVTEHGGIAAAVRTPEQWCAHPHGAATAGDPWSVVENRGPGRGPAAAASREPAALLAGVRVLDLTRVIAGPTCSQLLACLGADVLRIDRPDRPELLDQYLSNGMGKRSAAVDLSTSAEAVETFIADADVVLLGYRPGALARFGLAAEALVERHPHLVVASLSAWGEHGPWAQRPGFDSIVQAVSGIATSCGSVDRPGALPVQALDHATGYLMAAEVMGLLAARRAGIIRLSLLGAARTLLGHPAPPSVPPVEMPVRTLPLETPHGAVRTVPPALTVDGALLMEPITAYGRAIIG